MNGSDAADIDLLEDKYQEIKNEAEELRNQGDDEEAASKYRHAASVLEQIATKASTDWETRKRKQLANSLRKRADSLDDGNSARSRNTVDASSGGEAQQRAPEGSPSAKSSNNETSLIDPPEQAEKDNTLKQEEEISLADAELFSGPPDVTLGDVGGLEPELDQIRKGIKYPHEHPELYEAAGVEMSNGVLLHGPPGTGKTLIAKAVANELNEPYAGVSAAELGSEYVNVGAQNVEKLFTEARHFAPCVVFIDELDSLARSRSQGSEQTDGTRQMLTQMLQELSELDGSQVCVIGATNMVDDIDPAIKRSGRFDRKIRIGTPSAEDRREIFEVHLDDKRTQGIVDLDTLVAETEGFSGADIASVIQKAGQSNVADAIEAGCRDPESLSGLSQADLLEAIEETDPSIKEWEQQQSEEEWSF